MLLKVDNLSVYYGKNQVLDGVTMALDDGEVVCILGPNGAGKTSLVKAIVGLVGAAGRIEFRGQEIGGKAPEERVAMGLSLVAEGRHLFPMMSVWENLDLGGYVHRRERTDRRRAAEEIYELFPILAERRNQRAGTLSGGEQQMLAIARALMARPRLLLLDEPSLALAPRLIENVFDAIVTIHKRGIPILMVEQNAAMALSIASRACVLELGRIVLEGASKELEADERVRRAYLGL